MKYANNLKETLASVTSLSSLFANPCSLESGLETASPATREFLSHNPKFNAYFNGRSLVLTSLANPNDVLTTSDVLSAHIEGKGWSIWETRNSTISIWDEGFKASPKFPPFPVAAPKFVPASKVYSGYVSEYDFAKEERKVLEPDWFFGEFNFAHFRNDYGFISITGRDDVFCHVRNMTCTPYNGAKVIFCLKDTNRGENAVMVRLASDEEIATIEAARNALKAKAFAEAQAEADKWALKEHHDRLKEWNREKEFYNKNGFYAVNVTRGYKNNYGRAVWENYEFSRAIDLDEFRRYIKATGMNLTPETVDAPVCQGTIKLYRDMCEFYTCGTSKNWTRYESFVYYD